MNAAVATVIAVAAEEEFDPNDVTPGVEGFVITFIVMAIVVLLVLDMVRRIRRVNYRAEVREQLEAEQRAEHDADRAPGESAATPAPSDDADAAASDRSKPE